LDKPIMIILFLVLDNANAKHYLYMLKHECKIKKTKRNEASKSIKRQDIKYKTGKSKWHMFWHKQTSFIH